MSEPETCPGCALRVPDHSTWERQHREDCGGSCWCRAYCWKDGDCPPDLSAIAARARAEAFEEAAKIADEFGDRTWRWGSDDTQHGREHAAETIADEIRRRAKP